MMKHVALACACLTLCGPAFAADDDEVADAEFLEFLGSFDDGEGNWLDLAVLMEMGDESTVNDHDNDKAKGENETGRQERDDD